MFLEQAAILLPQAEKDSIIADDDAILGENDFVISFKKASI